MSNQGPSPQTGLLNTQLFIPPTRTDILSRSRLTGVMNDAVLDQRTEGWIAGLQMAALSMQGQQDVTSFIKDFTGDDRYVQTSILDRLAGPFE